MSTKKLFANGKFVCEYEDPGDRNREIELCRKLLAEHGIHAQTSEEQALFRQAVSFSTTSAYLYQRDLTSVPVNGMSAVPFVVNAVFALELYIKTLAKLYAVSLRGHDLVELFDGLPGAAKNDLADELTTSAAQSRWRCQISDIASLRLALDGMRNAFIEWRYLHEKDPSGGIEFPNLIFVMETFHAICQKHELIVPKK
jgi:hypothetical protein